MFMKPEGAPRGPVELKDLPEEKRVKIGELDVQADAIQDLRANLARRVLQVREWIPALPSGKTGSRALAELAGSSPTVEEAIARFDLSGLDSKGQKRARIRIREALNVAKSLEKAGGIRPGSEVTDRSAEAFDFYKARFHDLSAAAQTLTELRTAVSDNMIERMDCINDAYATSAAQFDAREHIEILQEITDEHTRLLKKLKDHILSSPEAYLAAKLINLGELKRHFDAKGRIVETAYVKQMKDVARDKIRSLPALFVTGELGAGKTEFAKDLARDLWVERNPAPVLPPELKTASTTEEKNAIRKEWAAKKDAWVARRDGPGGWEPLMVYGNKNIQTDEFFGGRGIERGESISAEEQAIRISEEWKRIVEALPKGSAVLQDLEAAREDFRLSMLEAFRSPVQTKTYLGPLLRAMKEGRPLIIDEMNAIPHHVLIALNTLLLMRPGETVIPPFPGEPPFNVAPGFVVIATGNYKPEDGKAYVGRQQMDAAFLSRFGLLSYDYLPMPTESLPDGSSPEAEREFRAKCEQTTMFVLRLLNNDLSLDVPPNAFGPNGQIERLAVVARRLQDVFSASEGGKGFYERTCGGEVNVKEVLKENVLSIRHVIPVLESWQKGGGFQTDLDEHLFMEYVKKSDTRPDEMVLLYSMLQTHGQFFPTTDKDGKPTGWPDAMLPQSRELILNFDVKTRLYGRDGVANERDFASKRTAPAPVRYTAKQVVAWLSGRPPERTVVPGGFSERDTEKKISTSDRAKLEDERLREDECDAISDLAATDEFAELFGEPTA